MTTTDFWPAPDEQRNVVYGRVDVPRLGLVNVFVTHTSGWGSVDTVPQIDEVKGYMAAMFRGDEALDLLMGDLNNPAGGEGYQTWLARPPFRLIDTFAEANSGQAGTTIVSTDDRIDFIMAGEGWPLSEDPAHYRSTVVFDGRSSAGVRTPVVSDHYGVATVFSLRK